MKKVIRNAINR